MSEQALDPTRVRAIIEAILLTAESPVTPGRLVDLLDGCNGRHVREAIDALKAQYEQAGHGITIAEVAGGFQLATCQEYGPWVRKFHSDRSQVRLSQAALETLSIIAFKQPITRVEIDSIRGVNSGGVLQTLMELNMARIVGRSDGIGKPMLFGTTREFLIHFGLRTLADLPKTKELEELLADGEAKAQARQQLALRLQERQGGEGGKPDASADELDELLGAEAPAEGQDASADLEVEAADDEELEVRAEGADESEESGDERF